jgi:hypothetical protein
LDYTISSYFFHYVNRGSLLAHPRLIIDQKMTEFCEILERQRQLVVERPSDALHLAYEDVVREPKTAFERLLRFLGLPAHDESIEFALKNSSKRKIKEMEAARGTAIVQGAGKSFKASFVRSGQVGEWKEYFNDLDLARFDELLSMKGFSLSDFVLD